MSDPAPLPYLLSGMTGGPVVLASPHSGRDYPAAFLAQARLTVAQLRRAEDAWVDELLAPARDAGAPLLAARYGRAYLDLNRASDELDPAMIADPLGPGAAAASDRVSAGLGVLPRIAAHGLDIYASRLRLADAEARIAALHAPWHARLESLLEDARAANGFAILLDCHSMPTPPPAGGPPPQFVLGDLHGRAAAPALVAAIERQVVLDGWRVARNAPYAGGYTTARHGRPAAGVHAVQIEIDRALYMDPARLQPNAGFARVAATLRRIAEMLMRDAASLGLGPWREAAE